MKHIVKITLNLATVLFILFLVILVLLKGINFGIPSRDSGAFLYAGKELLLQQTPYLNFWDHKAPLIYLLNAFALVINSRNLWGLWITEAICMTVSFFLLFNLLKTNFNKVVAIASLIIVAMTVPLLLEGGNRVEEYGLFFQVIALFVINRIGNHPHRLNFCLYYFLGLICACLFLLKPNLAVIFPVLILYFILNERSWTVIKKSLTVTIGFMSLIGLFLGYFFIKKAVFQLWDQVFYFNFLYSAANWHQRFSSLIYGVHLLLPTFLLGIFGIIFSFINKKSNTLIKFDLLWLPFEIISSILSGREYGHYFLVWIIPLSIFIAVFFSQIKNKVLLIFVLFLVVLVGYRHQALDLINNAYILRPFDRQLQYRGFNFNHYNEHADTLKAISLNTSSTDSVFIWGSEPALLFLSSRRTQSRFYYQFRLFYPGYNLDDSKTRELEQDLKTHPPKIIIDASSSTRDLELGGEMTLPPLNNIDMEKWFIQTQIKQTQSLKNISEFVKSNYYLLETTYGGQWLVYKRIN